MTDLVLKIVSVVLWFICIAISVYADYVTIVIDKITIDAKGHSARWAVRFFFCIFLSALWQPENWIQISLISFFYGSLFWILFDLGLNILRHERLLYVGQNAFLDKLLNSFHKEVIVLLIKVSLFLTSIYLLYVLY